MKLLHGLSFLTLLCIVAPQLLSAPPCSALDSGSPLPPPALPHGAAGVIRASAEPKVATTSTSAMLVASSTYFTPLLSSSQSYCPYHSSSGSSASSASSAGSLLFSPSCLLASIADVNNDQAPDLLFLDPAQSQINTALWSSDTSAFVSDAQRAVKFQTTSATVSGVVAADMNFDGVSDMVITFASPLGESQLQSPVHSATVLLGTGASFAPPADSLTPFVWANASSSPSLAPLASLVLLSVLDCSGDMLPDFFGVDAVSGKYACWVNTGSGNFSSTAATPIAGLETLAPLLANTSDVIALPQTYAVADLTGDGVADLILSEMLYLTASDSWSGRLVIASNIGGGKYSVYQSLSVDFGMGHLSFADMNSDGLIDIVFPVCGSPASCAARSDVVVALNTKSKGFDFATQTSTVSIKPFQFPSLATVATGSVSFALQPRIRLGDMNLDGNVDAVFTVWDASANATTTLLLLNTGEPTRPFPATGALSVPAASASSGAASMLFSVIFDVQNDGVPDLIVVSQSTSSAGQFAVSGFQKTDYEDAYFFKVFVSNGQCADSCGSKMFPSLKPYGINTYGPSVLYKSTDLSGSTRVIQGVQLPQNSFFALEVPYVLFGLGRTANYIETLEVFVPYTVGNTQTSGQWSSLVPNSMIVVFPSPLSDPAKWTMELFLSPGQTLLWTGVSLISTCAALVAVIVALQYREKREDEIEKRRTAHLFHFGES